MKWTNEANHLRGSFPELKQMHSEEKPASLKFNAPVAFSLQTVRPTALKRRRKYPVDHRCILSEFFPVEVASLEAEFRALEEDESIFCTSSYRQMWRL